ncbi:MAG: biotin/lipoyl-binding protein, partial [Proteobacteria bacterium]|nr:biotin/lipoyl-binding protein [Pseudomonadota bacterium]
MIRHFSQWFIVLAAGVILAAVLIFNHYRMEALANRPAPFMTTKAQLPDVVVITAKNISAEAQISGYGAAQPHFELLLTAQVAGQVIALAETFESGQRVSAGDMLIKLEDSDYLAAVTSAEKDLATANLDLLEEQRQGMQANTEWEASGLEGVPESELVLRQPHLAVAQAAVVNAEAALAGARKDLRQTRIVAPFNALVVE